MIYKDNYGNSYEKGKDGFFSDDEIDRRVKMGDLVSEEKYEKIKKLLFNK